MIHFGRNYQTFLEDIFDLTFDTEDLDFGLYPSHSLTEVISEWYYEYKKNYKVHPVVDEVGDSVLSHINTTDILLWKPEDIIEFFSNLNATFGSIPS